MQLLFETLEVPVAIVILAAVFYSYLVYCEYKVLQKNFWSIMQVTKIIDKCEASEMRNIGGWLRSPNADLDGRSPIELLINGGDRSVQIALERHLDRKTALTRGKRAPEI